MKNLPEAAEKLKTAENIVLFSDSDLDGITSALIAKETLEEIGKKPEVFFADRKRGYGLNPKSVEMLKDKAPATLVTMDCGISNFEGVKKAKEAGFEVVIIDHHEPHERVPEAELIVCPKLHDDDFKLYPNAGIIFELSKLILNEEKERFIELNGLAILGDMMPHKEVNAETLFKARQNFPCSQGVKMFSEVFEETDFNKLTQKMVPVLNITNFVSGVPEGYLYFLIKEKDHQRAIADKLVKAYRKRKEKAEEIKERLLKEDKGETIIFEGSKDWPAFLLGKIASKVVSEAKKPIFLYKDKGNISQGTARMPKGCNAVKAMKVSESILENYGGHPPAAGFTVKNENLEEFKKNLTDYFDKHLEK